MLPIELHRSVGDYDYDVSGGDGDDNRGLSSATRIPVVSPRRASTPSDASPHPPPDRSVDGGSGLCSSLAMTEPLRPLSFTTPSLHRPGSEGLAPDLEELSTSLLTLLNRKELSDVELYCCDDGVSVHAHRAILAARCQPFRMMFSGRSDWSGGGDAGERVWRETKLDRVPLSDISSDTLLCILHYLYSGTLPVTSETIFSVFRAADLYLLSRPRDMCITFFRRMLTPSVAIPLLLRALESQTTDLFEECVAYLCSHPDVLLSSPDLPLLDAASMLHIVKSNTLDLKEIDVFRLVCCWGGGSSTATASGGPSAALKSVLQYVRFPLLSQDDLFDIVEPSGLVPELLIVEACRFRALLGREEFWNDHMCPAPRAPKGSGGCDGSGGESSVVDESEARYCRMTFRHGLRCTKLSILPTRWVSIPLAGDSVPSPRYLHSGERLGANLYIFGGRDESSLDDLFVLNTKSMTWSRPVCTGTIPDPVRRHTAVSVAHRLFIFGGSSGTVRQGSVFILDTRSMHWTMVPDCVPHAPSRRFGHGCATVGDFMYVFGGSDEDNYMALNSMSVFDTRHCVWLGPTEFVTMGNAPSPRQAHSMTAIGTRLLVFGGGVWSWTENRWLEKYDDLYCFDTITRSWSKPVCEGAPPSRRTFHSANNVANRLLVYGGADSTQVLNDLYILEIDSSPMIWRKYDLPDNPRLHVHTSAIFGNQMVVYGGKSNSQSLCNLQALQLEFLLV